MMGAGEIQERLGVTRQRAYIIVGRRDFPAPYQVLKMGAIWDADDIEAWMREHRPELFEGVDEQ